MVSSYWPIYEPYPSPIRNNIYQYEYFSDAGKSGWGASFNNSVLLLKEALNAINGFWTEQEKHYHINVLELLAAYCALKTLFKFI